MNQLSTQRRTQVISCLVERMSIRATVRLGALSSRNAYVRGHFRTSSLVFAPANVTGNSDCASRSLRSTHETERRDGSHCRAGRNRLLTVEVGVCSSDGGSSVTAQRRQDGKSPVLSASSPVSDTIVLSQDIGDDVSRHSRHLVLCRWLVVPTRIDGEATHEDALGV